MKFSKNRIFEITFILFFSLDAITTTVNSLFNIVWGTNIIDTAIVYSIFFVLFFSNFLINLSKQDFTYFAFVLTLSFIFLIDYLRFPDNFPYLIELIFPLFMASLGLYFMNKITDYNNLSKLLKIIAYISFFLLFTQPFWPDNIIISLNDPNMIDGYMNFAYKIMPSIMILIFMFFKENNKFSLMLSLIGIIELVILGNRGALLSILVLIVLLILYQSSFTKTILVILFVFIPSILILSSNTILISFYTFFKSIGLPSDFLYRFINGTISNTNREWIYDTLINQLRTSNWFGRGLWGDRRILFDAFNQPTYAHNFILEMLIQFGYIFGGTLILSLFYSIITNFIKRKHLKVFIILFFSLIIPKLLFSSTYLIEPYFFALIGILFSMSHVKNKRRRDLL